MPAIEHSFSDPIVFAPSSGVHKQTVILLHGRGGSAEIFSERLLHMRIQRGQGSESPVIEDTAEVPSTTTLFEALPDTKFIFPCAQRQRATIYKRSIVRQWFDDWHLDPGLSSDVVDSRYDDGLQITGLGESFEYLRGLIAEEAKLVGSARNVVVGGFSQGAATSLITGILWDGHEPLGGIVTMSGWLPYLKQTTDISKHPSGRVQDDGTKDEEDGVGLSLDLDPFERQVPLVRTQRHMSDCQPNEVDHTAIEWLREEIDLPVVRQFRSCALNGLRTPAMLCHGSLDKQVEYQRGEQACSILPKLGLNPVSWSFHEGVDHDYSESILFNVTQFFKERFPPDANLLARSQGERQ